MIEKSLCILYQKDSAPHAMTLMKEIEFMIGLFTGTIDMQLYTREKSRGKAGRVL